VDQEPERCAPVASDGFDKLVVELTTTEVSREYLL
jgi:hypothetical protein